MTASTGVAISTMVRIILHHKRWTERELGERLGVAQSTVHRYASGERQPTYEVGARIVELYRRVRTKA